MGREYTFEAILREESDGGAYVVFPYDIRRKFGRGRVRVHAEFGGVPYDGSIVNMGVKDANGNVCYVIGVRKAIRARLGIADGDRVRVRITAGEEEP